VPTSVLLSIKPEFAEAIFSGTKRFEFRRAIYRHAKVDRILVYASSPVQKVIGEFAVAEILEMGIRDLWRATSGWAGIDRGYFHGYFRGRAKGYALRVLRPRRFKRPLDLRRDFGISYPPQSFCYVDRRESPKKDDARLTGRRQPRWVSLHKLMNSADLFSSYVPLTSRVSSAGFLSHLSGDIRASSTIVRSPSFLIL